MAEGILFNVAASLLTKLGSQALRELGLIWGVNDELQKLQSTVSSIKAVLIDAEEQQFKSNVVKDWIFKLKDAFYEIDDLIDDFSYESLSRQIMTKDTRKTKQVRIFFSKSNQIAFGLKMGHKVKEIRRKLDAIAADKMQFHFSEHTRDLELKKREDSHSYIPEEEVIGRGEDKRKIIDVLLDTNTTENISVCAIVGMGGLGKTALAQSVYNNKKITEHFELKLWVCISEVFDVKNIVGMILESATKKNCDSVGMEVLQSKLRKEIDGKKYLLIMDDVWNDNYEKWVNLKRLLMSGAKGSKIVITTRSEQVALTSDAATLYLLDGLSEDNSWLLFKQMAFKGREVLGNQNLVEIGKEIVAKLKGVPLAIRTIGRLLYFKESEVEWLSFKDNELSSVMLQENDMRSILMLSYNHLPFNLKQCFTYCALFPKDHRIPTDKLIKQWVAQGFVQKPHSMSKSIEDVGRDYLIELSWRSFFQDVETNEWRDITYCKMHDLMHDLACSIVESECVIADADNRLISRRTRHVSFISDTKKLEQFPKPLYEAKDLRTLLLSCSIDDHLYNKIFFEFSQLRSLTMRGRQIKELPKSINKLKHLRYLDLGFTSLSLLPSSVTELYNLETLILSYNSELRELPGDTKNWTHLRHLDLLKCDRLTCMPKGLGELTHLQTLNQFVVGKDDGSVLSELNDLNDLRGSLTIRGLEFCTTIGSTASYLKQKSQLRELHLEWGAIDDASVDHERVLECLQPHSNLLVLSLKEYQGVMLSDWLPYQSFGLLVSIKLWSCNQLQHLPSFSQFHSLKNLWLEKLDCVEYIDNGDSLSSATFFQSLEELRFEDMPKLKKWWKGETLAELAQESILLPKFPCLSKLNVLNCHNLTSFPSHQPLRSLRLKDVGVRFFDMVMKMTLSSVTGSSSTPSKLLILEIDNVEDIGILSEEYDNVDTSQQSLGNLRLLKLRSIGMEYLPNRLQHALCLQHLTLLNCWNLVTLPEWIGNFTSLTKLTIEGCAITSLPEGMRYLTSLSTLYICSCTGLSSLPSAISYLHSLKALYIMCCPSLLLRCEKEGEDWPKIAHVPELYLC